MEELLKFENVCFSYANAGKRIHILKDADITFNSGVLYSVVGQSGSGKTTTLSLAGALDSPQSGKILFGGKDIKKIGYSNYRKKNISIVFQNYNLLNYMTAIENVVMAMEISKVQVKNKKGKALEYLLSLGLTEDEAKRKVLQLSGGQQQRVAIARAVATESPVILADEPTGNLDVDTADSIIEIFKKLAHEMNKCIIVVTHSYELARETDVILKFEKGKLLPVQMQ